MNIVMLSLDHALLDTTGEGDTLERFRAYHKYCSTLAVIIPSDSIRTKRKVEDIDIIPAYGKSKPLSYWNIYLELKKICNKKTIDLVICNDAVLGSMALLLRKKFGFKVQISIFGLEILDKRWLKERPQNMILKYIQEWAIKRTDGLRTDNSKEKEMLIKNYGIAENKIAVVPVTMSQKSFQLFLDAKRNNKKRDALLGNKKHFVLAVGRLVYAKGFDVLIKAAEKVIKEKPEAMFIIAGEGPQRQYLEDLILANNLSDSIKLIGSINHSQLPELYASSDIFVLPSRYEGLPRVLMYAALTSVPIVTTDIDGASDLVSDKRSGIIVPIDNSDVLAQSIIYLLNNPETAKSLSKKALSTAQDYLDFHKSVKKIVSSWKQLVYAQ